MMSTTANDLETPKFIQFDYGARGFYCPNCNTGVNLNVKCCSYCGQLLENPYEVFNNDKG